MSAPVTGATAWRDIGPTSLAVVEHELRRRNSPMLPEAAAIHAAAGEHSALALAIAAKESQYGTALGVIPPESHNPLGLASGWANGGHTWHAFPDWASAFAFWKRSLTDPNGPYAKTTTLAELMNVYAPPIENDTPGYVDFIASYVGKYRALEAELGGGMAGQNIVVVAGHRSHNDPGNPAEKERTDDLARAYKAALTAAGHRVWWLQEHDGDSDPDDTVGGLDAVGQRTRDLCGSVDAAMMLDLHFEGTGNPAVRGCFAIVPDVTGLTTAVSGGAPADDTLANNSKDRDLARAFANRIQQTTGIPKRGGLVEPGVMSERSTGVGLQGFRLGMFAYTAGRRAATVRLVIEHGALTNPQDRAIIDAPGFYAKVGQAAVLAVADVYGGAVPQPVPTTPPPATHTFPWPGGLTDQDAAALSGIEPPPNFADPRQTWARAWAEEAVRTGLYSPHVGTLRQTGYRLFQLMNGRTWQIKDGQARGAWIEAGAKG